MTDGTAGPSADEELESDCRTALGLGFGEIVNRGRLAFQHFGDFGNREDVVVGSFCR